MPLTARAAAGTPTPAAPDEGRARAKRASAQPYVRPSSVPKARVGLTNSGASACTRCTSRAPPDGLHRSRLHPAFLGPSPGHLQLLGPEPRLGDVVRGPALLRTGAVV